MTRNALALISLALFLAAPVAEAGAAALKPLPVLNGVRCRSVINSTGMTGYACGRASDLRSYVVTIEIAKRSPYGPRPERPAPRAAGCARRAPASWATST